MKKKVYGQGPNLDGESQNADLKASKPIKTIW